MGYKVCGLRWDVFSQLPIYQQMAFIAEVAQPKFQSSFFIDLRLNGELPGQGI